MLTLALAFIIISRFLSALVTVNHLYIRLDKNIEESKFPTLIRGRGGRPGRLTFGYHIIAVDGFACPNDPRSQVLWGFIHLVRPLFPNRS